MTIHTSKILFVNLEDFYIGQEKDLFMCWLLDSSALSGDEPADSSADAKF